MTGSRARMTPPRIRPTPAPPQVASQRSSLLPSAKPRTAMTANSTNEQVARIFGGHTGRLAPTAMSAHTAATRPATPMAWSGSSLASSEKAIRGRKLRMRATGFMAVTCDFLGGGRIGHGGRSSAWPGEPPRLAALPLSSIAHPGRVIRHLADMAGRDALGSHLSCCQADAGTSWRGGEAPVKEPLYRRVNTQARNVRHDHGGDYRHQRNTKRERNSDET